MRAFKVIFLGVFLLILLSSCEKYYDKKYDEEFEISGSYDGTPFSQSGPLEFGMFQYEDYNVLLYNEVYLDFKINGIFEEQFPTTITQISFYLELTNSVGVLVNAPSTKKNSKKIAKFINNGSTWNSSDSKSVYIRFEPNDTLNFNFGSGMYFEGDYKISAENKGNWLFIEGDIPRVRIENPELTPSNPENIKNYYFDNFKFKFTVKIPS